MGDIKANFLHPRSVYHILVLVFGIIFTGLILNHKCIQCTDNKGISFQFINTTAGGFTLIMLVICVGIFFAEEPGRSMQLSLSYMAAIFHAVSMLSFGQECYSDPNDGRMLAATIFCGILLLLHLAEAIFYSCVVQRFSQ